MMNALAGTIGARTPYESHRRRLRELVRMQADSNGQPVPVARAIVARRVRLTPDQVSRIEKGKRKGLYDDIRDRIDDAFVAMAQRQIVVAQRRIVDLQREIDLARSDGRRVDPCLVAEAEAARDALEQLIAEGRGHVAPAAKPEEA